METHPNRYSASMSNLRSLLVIRSLVIMGQLALLWYLLQHGADTQTRTGMLWSVSAMAAVTALSFLRALAAWPVTDVEFGIQLGIDVLGLSALLYFSGGANNPFVSYYLVPLVISAAIMPRAYTWCIALLSLGGYSLLLFYHVPQPLFGLADHSSHDGPNIHVMGMWVNFIVSAVLITYFVVRMAAALKRQEREFAEKREDELRNEQILAVAGLAAGTAHELGTPLATMSVLLEELQEAESNPTRSDDFQLLQDQIQRCKSILEKLTRTAQLTDVGETHRVGLVSYTRGIVDHWLVTRPEVTIQLDIRGEGESPMLEVEFTLGQAIENLLNNAANAWPKDIVVEIDWDEDRVTIAVCDRGPGIPVHLMDRIGKPIIRDGGNGLGLGLLLSHATVNRYGGEIELLNRAHGGTRAILRLPR